jgi:carbonic anhydrase
MRLFEAIVEANHRAVAGDTNAGVHPAEFENELPLVALTCVDPRLNALFPSALGIPAEQFIWLRNAGNIITGPTSSTMRSLSLACAVKGGKEIAVIGHTDCQVCKTTTMQLLDKLKALGVERNLLPENLTEFFGMFGSERQNVVKACDFIRQSPLIGARVPVHGFLVDIETGKLEWIVNGYQAFATMTNKWNDVVKSAGQTMDKLKSLGDFNIGEMKFPETKIGEVVTRAEDWASQKIGEMEVKPFDVPTVPSSAVSTAEKIVEFAEKHWAKPPATKPGAAPPKIPMPPPIRPRMTIRRK